MSDEFTIPGFENLYNDKPDSIKPSDKVIESSNLPSKKIDNKKYTMTFMISGRNNYSLYYNDYNEVMQVKYEIDSEFEESKATKIVTIGPDMYGSYISFAISYYVGCIINEN